MLKSEQKYTDTTFKIGNTYYKVTRLMSQLVLHGSDVKQINSNNFLKLSTTVWLINIFLQSSAGSTMEMQVYIVGPAKLYLETQNLQHSF